MGTESVAVVKGTGSEKFTDAQFDEVASAYGGDEDGAKFKRLYDACAAIGIDELGQAMSRVDNLTLLLNNMAENGQGHTPPSGKGFGSDNAAVIAEKILGRAQTVGATRKAFSDWGKNV
jgi:hypothetical protein